MKLLLSLTLLSFSAALPWPRRKNKSPLERVAVTVDAVDSDLGADRRAEINLDVLPRRAPRQHRRKKRPERAIARGRTESGERQPTFNPHSTPVQPQFNSRSKKVLQAPRTRAPRRPTPTTASPASRTSFCPSTRSKASCRSALSGVRSRLDARRWGQHSLDARRGLNAQRDANERGRAPGAGLRESRSRCLASNRNP